MIAYAFHERIIEELMELLPEGKQLVTLGVTEPFLTSFKVSFYVAVALVLPVLLWQMWAFLAPAMAHATQRVIVRVRGHRDRAVLRGRHLLLRRSSCPGRSTS